MSKEPRRRRAPPSAVIQISPEIKKQPRGVIVSSPEAPRELLSKNEASQSKNGTDTNESVHHCKKQRLGKEPRSTPTMKVTSEPILGVKSRLRNKICKSSPSKLSYGEEGRRQIRSTDNGGVSLNEKIPKLPHNTSDVKRKEISLAEKMKVLDFVENNTERFTAKAFGISKTTVNAIKKYKLQIMTMYEASKKIDTSRCRRIRSTSSEDITNKTCRWFLSKYKMEEPVTNKELQEKACHYARVAGVSNFKASKGWLDSFKTRFGITLSRSVVSVKNVDSVHSYLEAKKVVKTSSEKSSASGIDRSAHSATFYRIKEIPKPFVPKLQKNRNIEMLTL